MTNQEYLEQHPTQFKDDIDKWLFTEFSIIGGCSSAQGSIEYSVARMVAERLFNAQGNRAYYECMDKVKKEWLDKAIKWLEDNIDRYLYNTGGYEEYIPKCGGKMFEDFKKAMEE